MPRALRCLALSACLSLASVSLCSADTFFTTDVHCGGPSIDVHWSLSESTHPPGYPNWTGIDVQRRPLPGCGPYVTVNPQPFPRVGGEYHYFDTVATGTMYEYRLIFVDANRQEVSVPDCYDCVRGGWGSCPNFSAPVTQGTLEDFGWALFLTPCPGSCYYYFYFEGPFVETLRPYAGNGTVVRLYGTPLCGTVEGCAIQVDHYELANCGVTPARRSSWGQVKTLYR